MTRYVLDNKALSLLLVANQDVPSVTPRSRDVSYVPDVTAARAGTKR